MPGLKGRFFERRKEARRERREERQEEPNEQKTLLSSSAGLLKSRPFRSWLKEREPLLGNREKLLFGIPRTSPDPLPPGITASQAVAAVESTSWAKGLAEGVCKAAGLIGPPYDLCVTNYKRKVALGALGLTTAQLTPEIFAPRRRGPGRPPRTEPEVPPAAPALPAPPEKHEKHEKQEHWQEGKKHANWIADVYMEIKRGNKIFFTGDPAKSGTKLVVFEKDSGNSYVSRPLSVQELDYIVRQLKKDKSLDVGIYGSPIEGAKKT